MGPHHRYSRWDGTQAGFELEGDDVLAEVADDVLYHGDVGAALRRAMHSGMTDRDGRHLPGLRELLDRIRRRRQAELESHDLSGILGDIAGELREVVETERDALDRMAAGGGERAAADRHHRLDLLPPDLAGQVRALEGYPFVSGEAQQRFQQLVSRLREQLLANLFDEMAGSMATQASTVQLDRTKDMLAALNRMLDARAAAAAEGDERPPDESERFAEFMEEFGDLFPSNPRDLDELLEQLAAQMAAMQALVNSMTPEQRAELQALGDQLLDDLDLRWQLDQLGAHLRASHPGMGWESSYGVSGQDPLDLSQGVQLMERLTQLDQLEQLLRSAMAPPSLADVDLDAAGELLGPDAAESLGRLAELAEMLQDAGLVDQREGRLQLTPKGVRRLGQRALSDLFGGLDLDRFGGHEVVSTGYGHERSYDTKQYEFGDPFHLNIERTLRNAIQRGGGPPVRLQPDDFEVDRTEALTRSATVVALDLSLSMPMRDNFLAAKKVAIALHALISSRYPQDYLGLVGFSEVARELRPDQLPEVSWDYVWGTNLQHALRLSRRMLARQSGTRQVILVTDGEPTAHVLAGGGAFFHYPPAAETIRATLGEVRRCTAEGIRINTFMLDATGPLRAFVERVARLNRGRVFATTPDSLGRYVLVDFLESRRAYRYPAS